MISGLRVWPIAVAYPELSAVVVAAVREQQSRIDALEARLERLEAEGGSVRDEGCQP